jgi:hypothetical protein
MNIEELCNIAMQEVGQRGKKRCPECDNSVGVRTYQCDCGYQFVNKKTQKQQQQEHDEETMAEERLYARSIGASGGRVIYAGAGRPSSPLREITLDAIRDYCNLIIHEGITEGKIYTTSAIKHYLLHQFECGSQDYIQATKLVDKWYDEIIGVDTPSCMEN